MKKARIVVLAGQSNAVGVGHAACLPKHFSADKIQEYYNGYENVKINYFSHDKKSNGFVKTTVGCTEIYKNTIGPELGMAEWFQEHYPNEELFIVKCAFGGKTLFRDWLSPSSGGAYDKHAYADQIENITQWKESSRIPIRSGWCYNELVKLLSESIDILKKAGYMPTIIGFCWMQGESDARMWEHASQYGIHYTNLITDFKNTFAEYTDQCTFVDGGIDKQYKYTHEINEFKKSYALTHSNCYYIDTNAHGLTTANEPDDKPDLAHYDSNCVIQLGKLFAEKIPLA